jgi:formiminoglutamate deiminase
MRLWCERAILPGATLTRGVLIEINGDTGLIESVSAGAACPADAQVIDGVVLPGCANAHSHAFHRALRGRTHGGLGDFWTWRSQMYQVAARLDPSNYEALATAVFAEMVLAGYTVVGEFHYVHHDGDGRPYGDDAMERAIVTAAARAGIRLTLLDACYLNGGIGVALQEEQRRFCDGSAERWANRVSGLGSMTGPTVRIGSAIHSVRAVDPAACAEVAVFAKRHSMVLHAHVSEQPAENTACLDAYGKSPVAILAEADALSDRFTAVHATHLQPDDVAVLGRHHCVCCFCPTTERDLADGIGPSVDLLDSGAAICIGSDQHGVIDPFEEMRAVELNTRLSTLQRGNHSVPALFEMATMAGYRSLGWHGGALAPYQVADLVVIDDQRSPRFAGSDDESLVASLVFGGTSSDVRDVMVGGKWIVRSRVHQQVDAVAALSEAIGSVIR